MAAPPDDIEIAVPRPENAESLLLHVAIGLDTYKAFLPDGWEPPDTLVPDMAERMRTNLAREDCYARMAVYVRDPVAHVHWEHMPMEDLFHLRGLFVLPPWWGTGLAGRLHDMAIDAARSAGHRRGRLFTPVAHARARTFYEHRGWVLVDEAHAEQLALDMAQYRLEL